jgi:hypothetical protein
MTNRMKNHLRFPLFPLACLALATGPAHAELIAHWKFDDGSGTTAVDSAKSNNGTLIGDPLPTWISGAAAKVGGALEFGGVANQEVVATVTGLPTGNTVRTISLWLWADLNVFDQKFLSYGTTASGTNFSWTIEPATTGGAPTIFFRWSGGNRQYTGASVALGTWNHVAIVVPQDTVNAGSVLLYLNGSAVTTGVTTNNRALNTGLTDLVLGGAVGALSGANLDGRLDDVQIYNTALTPAEILSLFNNPGSVIGGAPGVTPVITSFNSQGSGVWELTLKADPNSSWQFRSSTTLEFTPGTLVEPLIDAGGPGTIGGTNNSVLTTDSSGDAKVRLTLTGSPADFVRGVEFP